MKGLFYKEIVLFRRTLVVLSFVIIYFAVFGFAVTVMANDKEPMMSVMGRGVICFVSFFLSGFVGTELFKYDENSRWISFAASTPTGLKGQILSKFILFFIINAAVLMIFIIQDTVYGFFSDVRSTVKIYILIFSVQNILNSVELPFVVRFGADKGGAVKAAFITAVLLLLGVYGLFGNIDFLLGDDPIGDLIKLTEKITFKRLMVILPFVSFISYILSYFISLLLYRKGAESYEQ